MPGDVGQEEAELLEEEGYYLDIPTMYNVKCDEAEVWGERHNGFILNQNSSPLQIKKKKITWPCNFIPITWG